MSSPKIVFCITSKNRTQHLRQTLPANLKANPNSDFIVLDYYSNDDLTTFLQTLASERLTTYHYRGHNTFRMAHAKNLAHRLAINHEADILVNLDADNYSPTGFTNFILEQFKKPEVFLWAKMVKGELRRGISGRIVVSREAFLRVGGYDERFEKWGPDDKDFNSRLLAAGYNGLQIDNQYLQAISHNDKMRFREYPEASKPKYSDKSIANKVEQVVVNGGNIGTGTVFKNHDPDNLIQVKPVINRIFGVGLSKTGTCSLHAAFQLLGFSSWHWASAHDAKNIWRDVSNLGRSDVVDKYQALCDLPIPLLYQKLDHSYPGSKFILTIRDEHSWLNSISRHFSSDNIWRSNWDNDPFSHRAHKLAFGRKHFDPDVFIERYRQHNHEVMEYFRNRPNDFLLMRIDHHDGWQKLCPFVDVPIFEGQAFPHINKTEPLIYKNAPY